MGKDNSSETFACTSCGADLKYSAGTDHLKCEHCGAENSIEVKDIEIRELDFFAHLKDNSSLDSKIELNVVKCVSCGAESTLEPHIVSSSCPYCSVPLIVQNGHEESIIQPKSLLPFKVDKSGAISSFKLWIDKLWFIPSEFKRAVIGLDRFKGVYIPFWTYDSDTSSQYVGMRGIYYYVTETYTTTVNGKSETRTRSVRKTRWYPASGEVDHFFDDILISASESLPKRKVAELEPWDLENLIPFDIKYLSGYITEKYQIDLEGGFNLAKNLMKQDINELVRRDIGGDTQSISRVNTDYDNITFKHILLPCYISAYKYKDKLYQFMVNARTGEVQGERPYAVGKIVAVVALGLAVVAIVLYLCGVFEPDSLSQEQYSY